MTIDLLTESDIPAALRLSTQSGWNQIEADWRRLLTLWPQTCFAGRVGGRLIATSTLATYGTSLGWVGMVLVDEQFRGQGFGGAILDAALDAGRALGLATIGLDATDLGRPVYLKRSLSDVARIDRWLRPAGGLKNIAPLASPPEPRTPPHPGELNALDQKFTGLDRSNLLESLQSEEGIQTGVARRAARLAGFALVRNGRFASHVGPVVAETENDAIAAIDDAFRHAVADADRPLIIDVPTGRLTNWLRDNGFALNRKLTRMCVGPAHRFLDNRHVFAATSFELG